MEIDRAPSLLAIVMMECKEDGLDSGSIPLFDVIPFPILLLVSPPTLLPPPPPPTEYPSRAEPEDNNRADSNKFASSKALNFASGLERNCNSNFSNSISSSFDPLSHSFSILALHPSKDCDCPPKTLLLPLSSALEFDNLRCLGPKGRGGTIVSQSFAFAFAFTCGFTSSPPFPLVQSLSHFPMDLSNVLPTSTSPTICSSFLPHSRGMGVGHIANTAKCIGKHPCLVSLILAASGYCSKIINIALHASTHGSSHG
mmetsp:Transcript_3562/g.6731  ORF Transcript_3562/g.6731 Transcript_3562/m.6731 type:complete len:256 (+) Transcript_3562:1591-2358(+)